MRRKAVFPMICTLLASRQPPKIISTQDQAKGRRLSTDMILRLLLWEVPRTAAAQESVGHGEGTEKDDGLGYTVQQSRAYRAYHVMSTLVGSMSSGT